MQVRSALSRIVGHACAAFVACAIVTGAAEARQPGTAYLGQPCTAVGELVTSGYVFVCSDANVFRYALHEDIPPAPEDGYVERPSWYPRLSEIFLATDPPACSITGRVTFTSPVIRPEHTTVIVPQGQLIFDHVTPIDHGYIGVTLLGRDPATLTDADFAPILAPADAEIIEISLLSATSIRIVLAHGCETYSVLMVVNRLSGALGYLQDDLMASGSLSPHIRVLAGEEIAAQRDNPFDFSVPVGASWLSGFVERSITTSQAPRRGTGSCLGRSGTPATPWRHSARASRSQGARWRARTSTRGATSRSFVTRSSRDAGSSPPAGGRTRRAIPSNMS